MKTIVVQTNQERGQQDLLISILGTLFPECEIRIAAGGNQEHQRRKEKNDRNSNDR